MNIQETAGILEVLKYAYPKFYSDMTTEETDGAIKLWAMMFEEDEAQIVTQAVKAMISTLKYPPTIADVKEKIQLMTTRTTMTEMEAWSLVYRAICNSAYDSESQFNRLPLIVQKILATPKQLREWALSENLNLSVIQSNFMRSYKVMSERNEMINRLPESCKNLINGKQEGLCLNVTGAEEGDLFPM